MEGYVIMSIVKEFFKQILRAYKSQRTVSMNRIPSLFIIGTTVFHMKM